MVVFGVTVRVRGNKSRRFLSAFDYRKLFVNLYKLILKERVSDSCGIYQLNLCNINLEPGPLNSDKLCTKLGNAFDSLNKIFVQVGFYHLHLQSQALKV